MRRHFLLSFFLVIILAGCSASEEPAGLPALVNPVAGVQVDFYPTAVSMGDGVFAMAQTDYGENITTVTFFDGNRNLPIRQMQWNGAVTIVPSLSESVFLVLSDPLSSNMYLVDEDLQVFSVVKNVVQPGLLSRDRTKWYYLEGELLFQLDLQTGISKIMDIPENLGVSYLSSIDPKTDALVLRVYRNSYRYDTCTAVLDVNTGEFLYFSGNNSLPVVMDHQVILQKGPGFSPGLVWGSLGEDEISMSQVDISKIGIPPTNLVGLGNGFLTNTSGKSFQSGEHYLYRLGEGLNVWNLTELGLPENSVILTPMAGTNWLLCLNYTASDHQLFLVDLNQLPQTEGVSNERTFRMHAKGPSVLSQIQSAPTWGTVSAGYETARAYADRLEAQFDLTIYMENQCAPLQDVTLIPYSLSYAPERTYLQALGYLEEAMRLYPTNFFSQFRQERRDGIVLLLTGPMLSDYDAIGFEEQFRNSYVIALDVTGVSDVIGGTFCHEIWHATEDFATGKIPATSLQDTWNRCNPPGFSYTYAHSAAVYSQYAYLSGSRNIYFADNYSCTYPTEDRARIMEYAMWYPEHFKIMLEYEPIRQKLKILQNLISESFDTSTWSTPRWEEY